MSEMQPTHDGYGVHECDGTCAPQMARGSDDEYCSAYPPDGHHYVSHSVRADPVRWVDRCSLCGHISSARLREQLVSPERAVPASVRPWYDKQYREYEETVDRD